MARQAQSSSRALKAAARADEHMPEELLEFQSPSAAIVALPVPIASRSAGWLVFVMFAAFVAVAGLMPIDKVVSATGRVIAQAPTLVVQPLETAIVRSIDVHEGEAVHKGQILAQLDPTFAEADMKTYGAQVASLSAEVDRLRAETDGKPFTYSGTDPSLSLQAAIYAQRQAQFMATMQSYNQKVASLQATMDRAMSDVAGYQQRLTVANEVEGMRAELDKLHVGSKLNLLSAQDARMEILRSLQNAANTAAGARNDMDSTKAERDAYAQQWRADIAQKLADQTRALSDATESYNKAKLRTQLVVLRADKDATVLSIAKVSVGSVMQSGQQFFTLVPKDSPMEVEAFVSGSDSGYVALGDATTIKFDTFPYTRYGTATGSVRLMSADSFTQADATQSSTAASTGVPAPPQSLPYYVARIGIDQVKLRGVPAGFHITPGMPVTADIKVGKRTILSYLLSRVLPLSKDAMREPN